MYQIDIQEASNHLLAPKKTVLRKIAKTVLQEYVQDCEITIRLVKSDEMAQLNEAYRNKKGSTNVLSFPYELQMSGDKSYLLGDLVICSEVVNQEAFLQHKNPAAHWAHMIVHGILHLLGYDHEHEHEAMIMENLEIKIMRKLGFENPYLIGE